MLSSILIIFLSNSKKALDFCYANISSCMTHVYFSVCSSTTELHFIVHHLISGTTSHPSAVSHLRSHLASPSIPPSMMLLSYSQIYTFLSIQTLSSFQTVVELLFSQTCTHPLPFNLHRGVSRVFKKQNTQASAHHFPF